jgi:hypothetical protein
MGSENAATPILSFATPEWLKSFNGGPQNLYAVVSKEAPDSPLPALRIRLIT